MEGEKKWHQKEILQTILKNELTKQLDYSKYEYSDNEKLIIVEKSSKNIFNIGEKIIKLYPFLIEKSII